MLPAVNPVSKPLIPRWFLKDIKYRAKKHNISFDLTIEELEALFLEQDKKCFYTGTPLYFGVREQKQASRSGQKIGNTSLDRTFSNLPYTLNNVKFTTKIVNLSKHTSTPEEFIKNCQKVVEYAKQSECVK